MQILDQMLLKYDLVTIEDKKNAMKEIIQEVVLCGLARSSFFKHAAFYGGTALRIFYGIDRFSEDLDFSLLIKDLDFSFDQFIPAIIAEVESLGLSLDIGNKLKSRETQIESAFVTGNTKQQYLIFYPKDQNQVQMLHPYEKITVKFEVDINPPANATTELKYRLLPSPYQVRIYDESSLFAGKIDAVLRREWKTRVKGRDFYDYLFFIARSTPVNMRHLKARLVQSGFIKEDFDLNKESLIEMLYLIFNRVDFEAAKKDMVPFIKDTRQLDIWSCDFFKDITKQIKVI